MTKTTTAAAAAATKPVTSYAAAYGQLAAIADRLKGSGTSATIDTLAEDVAAARRAFSLAKERLDAIRAEIDAELAPSTEGTAR